MRKKHQNCASVRICLSLAVGSILGVFSSACRSDVPIAAESKSVADYFPINLGGETVRLQFALNGAEQERGLMYRTDLGADQGMVFVFATPRQQSFWMRNTPTPLDISYFSGDGQLREVYPARPFDDTNIVSRRNDIQIVVEMKEGWFAQRKIRPGARLDMSALKAAIKARGFDPDTFRLP